MHCRVLPAFAALVGLSCILGTSSARAWPGELDPTFGKGGKVVTEIGDQSFARAVLIQSGGKIVAAGTASESESAASYLALARYREDGSLDESFGNGGVAKTRIGERRIALYAAARQADDKIVVAGSTLDSPYLDLLLRYDPDGALDQSFGSGGVVLERGACESLDAGVAVQQDGDIVVMRGSRSCGSLLARYDASGRVDRSFGAGGKVSAPSIEYRAVALQPDGLIVVVERGFGVTRYALDGSLDIEFERMIITGSPQANAIAVQDDGSIIVGGSDYLQGGRVLMFGRFYADGSRDPWFFDGRIPFYPDSFDASTANTFALRRDGKIVVGGEGAGRFALARLRRDGHADTHFGVGGVLRSRIPGTVNALALQRNGRIVAAGEGITQGGRSFTVARYLNTSHSLTVRRIGKGRGRIAIRPPGDVCRSYCTRSFAIGSRIALTAKPAANSVFIRWSGACRGKGRRICHVTLTDRNLFVRAVFARRPRR